MKSGQESQEEIWIFSGRERGEGGIHKIQKEGDDEEGDVRRAMRDLAGWAGCLQAAPLAIVLLPCETLQ